LPDGHLIKFQALKKRPLPPWQERLPGLWEGKYYFAAVVDAGVSAGAGVGLAWLAAVSTMIRALL